MKNIDTRTFLFIFIGVIVVALVVAYPYISSSGQFIGGAKYVPDLVKKIESNTLTVANGPSTTPFMASDIYDMSTNRQNTYSIVAYLGSRAGYRGTFAGWFDYLNDRFTDESSLASNDVLMIGTNTDSPWYEQEIQMVTNTGNIIIYFPEMRFSVSTNMWMYVATDGSTYSACTNNNYCYDPQLNAIDAMVPEHLLRAAPCGNGICDYDETSETCAIDCGDLEYLESREYVITNSGVPPIANCDAFCTQMGTMCIRTMISGTAILSCSEQLSVGDSCICTTSAYKPLNPVAVR